MSPRPSLLDNHNETLTKCLEKRTSIFIIMRLIPKCLMEAVLSYNHKETESNMSHESTLKLSHNASIFNVHDETEQNVSDHNILNIYI